MSKDMLVRSCYECPLRKAIHEGIKMKIVCSETGKGVSNCSDRIAKSCPYRIKSVK